MGSRFPISLIWLKHFSWPGKKKKKKVNYYVPNLWSMREKESFISQYSLKRYRSKKYNSNSHKLTFVNCRVTGFMPVAAGTQLWEMSWLAPLGLWGQSSASLGQPPHQNSWHVPQLRTYSYLERMHSGKTFNSSPCGQDSQKGGQQLWWSH